jgi:hypothetical protein
MRCIKQTACKGKELQVKGVKNQMRDVTRPLLISGEEKHDMSTRRTPKVFRWAGVLLIFACGLIHLISAPDHLQEATYLGATVD